MLSQMILFSMKSDDQCRHKEKGILTFSRKRWYQTPLQIALALSLRQSDRNSDVIRLINAYGITISPIQTYGNKDS